MATTQPLLRIEDLQITYRTVDRLVFAVNGTSIDLLAGEVVAIVGESGSGKSSLALAISRLLPPAARISGGRILYKGTNVLELSDDELPRVRGKEIAMIFQEPVSYLNPLIKVGEQVAEAILLHDGVGRDEARRRAVDTLRRVRIADPERIAHYYPHQLSGGMAQRVGIAMAIASRPSLLVADEPTSNLDLTVQSQILHLLKTVKSEIDTSILLITHDLGVVAGVADRVVVMYAGQVVEEAPVSAMFGEPKHPYTQALLEASSYSQRGTAAVALRGSPPDMSAPPPGCKFHPRCPYAFDKCQRVDPPLLRLAGNRQVACWLYEQSS